MPRGRSAVKHAREEAGRRAMHWRRGGFFVEASLLSPTVIDAPTYAHFLDAAGGLVGTLRELDTEHFMRFVRQSALLANSRKRGAAAQEGRPRGQRIAQAGEDDVLSEITEPA
jgi:hypothetical protein